MSKDHVDFVIIKSDTCPYCIDAMEILESLPDKYQVRVRDIKDVNKNAKLETDIAEATNNYKYIPIIFYLGKFIGGLAELKVLLKKKRIPHKLPNKEPDTPDFAIFKTDTCPYCVKAVSILKSLPKKYKVIYKNLSDLSYKIQTNLDKTTNNYPYVPIILYKGEFIGGLAELKALLKKKKIQYKQ